LTPADDSIGILEFEVTDADEGQRIDLFISLHCDGYSRVFLKKVLSAGRVLVNGERIKPSFKVFAGQTVNIDLPPPPDDGPIAEDIPLDILFEDDAMVVINKSPGMVVHPAKGHWSGTLTSALAYHFKDLSTAGGPTRPGIVHRLDRDTSGVILIAKTNQVHFHLSAQFEHRQVQKQYLAIGVGSLDLDSDVINAPIGHHPYQRDKMAIRHDHESSRSAETLFQVTERFPGYTYLTLRPKTGRTHQIRVHLAHIGCAVLCDKKYAGHSKITRSQLQRKQLLSQPVSEADEEVILDRHALHAQKLTITHPTTNEPISFEAPIPPDIAAVLDALRGQPLNEYL
jgi:23S rRNA pseudouridine1911/1915/1917 synthase